jgi:hypothetical protein
MATNYQLTIDLKVVDSKALLADAQRIAKRDGDDGVGLVDANGQIDVPACLIMILDPGSSPGLSINGSDVESYSI